MKDQNFTPDNILRERLRRGDLDSVAELWQKYHQKLYNFLYSILHNHHDVEDAIQEAFLSICKCALEGEGNLMTLIFTIAKNAALKKRKKRQKNKCENLKDENLKDENLKDENLKDVQELVDNQQERQKNKCENLKDVQELVDNQALEPLEQIQKKEEKEMLLSCINKLPERYHLIIFLRYYEGRQSKVISEILQIPEGTIRSQQHRALGILKGCMSKKKGGTL